MVVGNKRKRDWIDNIVIFVCFPSDSPPTETALRRPKLVILADENKFARDRIGRIIEMLGMGNRFGGVVRCLKTGVHPFVLYKM